MHILYVNHTGNVSGGEKSLLEVLKGVSARMPVSVACPDGPLADALAPLDVTRHRIGQTDGSLKLHPRHTSEALVRMSSAALAVRSIARRESVDIVHANSIRAGLIVTLARRAGGPPTVVHLRDRLPASKAARMTLRAIGKADELIANSRYTAAALDEAGVDHNARILGNPVDLERFDRARSDRPQARRALGVGEHDFAATVLAQITPWKGQDDAIAAIARVHRAHPGAKLLIVGSAKFVSKATRYDNRAYLAILHAQVAELGLQDAVRFAGETDDVVSVLAASDALLVPSWEEPFGRSVVEAMAMGVPVIATEVGGPAEVITDGVDGLLREPRNPDAWATAIRTLITSDELRAQLAWGGLRRAQDFSVTSHAASLSDIYAEVMFRRSGVADVPVIGVPDTGLALPDAAAAMSDATVAMPDAAGTLVP